MVDAPTGREGRQVIVKPATAVFAMVIVALLTSCSSGYMNAATQTSYSTVTVSAPAPQPRETPASRSSGFYEGKLHADGVFIVGNGSSMGFADRVNGQIPPGRYRVEVAPDEREGSWIRCQSLPCGPAYPASTIVAAQITGSQSPELLTVNVTDFAIWLSNVNLTAVN